MAALKGGIITDWKQSMPPDSPTVDLEVVGSSYPPVTARPPAAARPDTDDSSDGGDYGDAAEFAGYTDQKLQDTINRWRGKINMPALPDAGKNLRRRVRRMKKELERRKRKDADTVQRQTVKAKCTRGSEGDVYTFNLGDEILDTTAGAYSKNSSSTSPTNAYTQDKAATHNKRSYLSLDKCAYPKKDGKIAKDSASHRFKTCARRSKSTDHECLDTDIDRRKKPTLRSCTRNSQKSNTVDAKGSKFLEGATFGSKRNWNLAKNKASASFKKDVVLLDDDDDDAETAKSNDAELSNKWDESKIYYPSRTDPEAVELTYSDMKCLGPEGYLKSPVINFYLQYLKKSRPRSDLHMFSTYFYSKLEEALSAMGDCDSQFSKLRRWWTGVDIFKKAYIILPINETMHWSLIIVCMPTKGTDSGPIMLHLDSLGLHTSEKLFKTVASYLKAEWRHLQKDSSYDIPFSGTVWKRLPSFMDGAKVEVPRQRNEYDCGLFMLYYIDKFIQEAPERLTKERLGMFGRRWFNHEEASQLREGIRACLFDLFQSAQEDDGPSKLEWHPGDHSEGKAKDVDTDMATL